jgi:hypothetical protein
MAKVINLYAASGKNIIDDDSTPTLTLENTDSGECLKLQNAGGTGVGLSLVSTPTTALHIKGAKSGIVVEADTSEVAITAGHVSTLGAVTVAPLRLVSSGVSGCFISFQGAFASAASCPSLTRAVRVKIDDSYYWIPLYESIIYV